MEICVAIMAGGIGERFWPASRKRKPKQFLSIFEDKISFIQKTFFRALKVTSLENVFISIREDLISLCRTVLPELPIEQYIVEPLGKDTAAAMGLASVFIENIRPGSILVIMPSDHFIEPEETFVEDIFVACKTAKNLDCIVTLGIKPSRVETGYGYIEKGEVVHKTQEGRNVFEVRKFTEKPDKKTAEDWIRSGNFLWNSGIFIWKPSIFLSELERFLPEHYHSLRDIESFLNRPDMIDKAKPLFEKLTPVSVDYGVMEKTKNILCLPANFLWDDVGSWSSIERFFKKDENGNTIYGKSLAFNSKNSIAVNWNDDGITVVAGLENIVIIRTSDVVLVYDKRKEDMLKDLLKEIKKDSDLSGFL